MSRPDTVQLYMFLICSWMSATVMMSGSCLWRLLSSPFKSCSHFAKCYVSSLFPICSSSTVQFLLSVVLLLLCYCTAVAVHLGWFLENRTFVFLAFASQVHFLNLVSSAVSLCLVVFRSPDGVRSLYFFSVAESYP